MHLFKKTSKRTMVLVGMGVVALVVLLSLALLVLLSQKVEELHLRVATSLVTLSRSIDDTNALISALAEGNDELKQALNNEREKLSQAEARRSEALAVQEKLSSQVATLSGEVQAASKADISNSINVWSPRVGKLSCKFLINGRSATGRGSAVASMKDGKAAFITNRHVLTAGDTQIPTSCTVELPDIQREFQIDNDAIIVLTAKDIAYLPVFEASLPQVLNSTAQVCQKKPSIGDGVVILGYPRVGSGESITVTDGIVSGIEEKYYITNAKIEQGNSGGAAILAKDNCLLGIPTLVVVGEVESFARILPL